MGVPNAAYNVVNQHALAAPGADTDFPAAVASGFKGVTGGAFRITVALATTSVLNLRVTDGSTPYTQALNDNTALTAGNLYTFVVGCHADYTYAFQVETDSIIQTLIVDVVTGAAL